MAPSEHSSDNSVSVKVKTGCKPQTVHLDIHKFWNNDKVKKYHEIKTRPITKVGFKVC